MARGGKIRENDRGRKGKYWEKQQADIEKIDKIIDKEMREFDKEMDEIDEQHKFLIDQRSDE